MEKLTIEQVVKIRKEFKQCEKNEDAGHYSYGERQTLIDILKGDYDFYINNGDVINIVNDDIKFLNKNKYRRIK